MSSYQHVCKADSILKITCSENNPLQVKHAKRSELFSYHLLLIQSLNGHSIEARAIWQVLLSFSPHSSKFLPFWHLGSFLLKGYNWTYWNSAETTEYTFQVSTICCLKKCSHNLGLVLLPSAFFLLPCSWPLYHWEQVLPTYSVKSFMILNTFNRIHVQVPQFQGKHSQFLLPISISGIILIITFSLHIFLKVQHIILTVFHKGPSKLRLLCSCILMPPSMNPSLLINLPCQVYPF